VFLGQHSAPVAMLQPHAFTFDDLNCASAVAGSTQISALQVDILVGTPLLAGKLIKSERLQLATTRFLVLDEQFVEQVDAVLAACTNPHLVRVHVAFVDIIGKQLALH
jgi:hypothetical protein